MVLESLPQQVLHDFLEDPRFRITKLNPNSDSGMTLLALPAADGRGSRCVVLKQRLAECSESFGLYVIAHEFAHAHLHNGPWGDITDPEEAADALAASWGFPRPEFMVLNRVVRSLPAVAVSEPTLAALSIDG